MRKGRLDENEVTTGRSGKGRVPPMGVVWRGTAREKDQRGSEHHFVLRPERGDGKGRDLGEFDAGRIARNEQSLQETEDVVLKDRFIQDEHLTAFSRHTHSCSSFMTFDCF